MNAWRTNLVKALCLLSLPLLSSCLSNPYRPRYPEQDIYKYGQRARAADQYRRGWTRKRVHDLYGMPWKTSNIRQTGAEDAFMKRLVNKIETETGKRVYVCDVHVVTRGVPARHNGSTYIGHDYVAYDQDERVMRASRKFFR